MRWIPLVLAWPLAAHADPKPLADVAQLSVGPGHVCAVLGDGAVACWGDNASGQVCVNAAGTSAPTSVARPQRVGGLPKIRRVAAGRQHTCAISTEDRVWCWGSAGGDLKVGAGGTSGSSELKGAGLGTPVEMPLGDGAARAIAVGHRHACAAYTSEVRCWPTFQTIPIGATKITAPTISITKLAGVTSLAMGHGKVCATTPKALLCWRDGIAPSPARIARVAAISIGELYACARTTTGEARCWWSLIDDFWKRAPEKLITWRGKRATKAIVAGDSPICTVDVTGAVDCFLSDEQGLPDQAVEASWATTELAPHPIRGTGNAIDIGIGHGRDVFGYGFGCVLRGDRTVACWGDNEHGQLGRGTTTRDKSAKPVLAP